MLLGIYGTGGSGREIFEIVELINTQKKNSYQLAFIDDYRNGESLYGVKIYSFDSFLTEHPPTSAQAIIGVGEPSLRKILWNKVTEANYSCPSLIHPSAYVSKRARIGSGTIVRKDVTVSCDSTVANNTDIMVNVFLGHDSQIGSHCQIASLASIGGYCVIGDGVFVGQGAAIRENVSIGKESIIGMGAVVLNSFPPTTIAYGNPARVSSSASSKAVFKQNLESKLYASD